MCKHMTKMNDHPHDYMNGDWMAGKTIQANYKQREVTKQGISAKREGCQNSNSKGEKMMREKNVLVHFYVMQCFFLK